MKHEGIGIASFYQWRAKLGESITEPKPQGAKDGTLNTAGFVDLGTLSASVSRFQWRLDLGGGVLLQLVRE